MASKKIRKISPNCDSISAVGSPAFHIQAQNRSQHVAPLNEELLRKQSEDSVNGECWSEGRKKIEEKQSYNCGKSIDLKGWNQSQLRPPARISGTCLAQHFSPS